MAAWENLKKKAFMQAKTPTYVFEIWLLVEGNILILIHKQRSEATLFIFLVV